MNPDLADPAPNPVPTRPTRPTPNLASFLAEYRPEPINTEGWNEELLMLHAESLVLAAEMACLSKQLDASFATLELNQHFVVLDFPMPERKQPAKARKKAYHYPHKKSPVRNQHSRRKDAV